VVSFSPRPLYSWGKSPQNKLGRMLDMINAYKILKHLKGKGHLETSRYLEKNRPARIKDEDYFNQAEGKVSRSLRTR
jgi:hypothetical protein